MSHWEENLSLVGLKSDYKYRWQVKFHKGLREMYIYFKPFISTSSRREKNQYQGESKEVKNSFELKQRT